VALDVGELFLRGIRRGRLLRGRLLLLVALDGQARRPAEPAGGSEQRGDRSIAGRPLEPDQRRGPVAGPVASCCRRRDVAGRVAGAVPASCDDHRSSVPVQWITDRAHLPALTGIDSPERMRVASAMVRVKGAPRLFDLERTATACLSRVATRYRTARRGHRGGSVSRPICIPWLTGGALPQRVGSGEQCHERVTSGFRTRLVTRSRGRFPAGNFDGRQCRGEERP
jgi:hypothetical protein